MRAAQPKNLELYVTPEGRTPFTVWVAVLKDIKARAKIRVRLDRLRLGNLGGLPTGRRWRFGTARRFRPRLSCVLWPGGKQKDRASVGG